MKNKLRNIGLCLASTFVAGTLTYYFFPIAMGVFCVVFTHEFGHYFAAILTESEAVLPRFIWLGLFIIGYTIVYPSSSQARKIIALSGPTAGAFAAAILLTAAVYGFFPIGAACIALGFEIWSLVFGSDAKKFRQS